MKKRIITALFSFAALTSAAQDVWTEGTTWKTGYSSEINTYTSVFTLVSAMKVDGVEYYPLTLIQEERCDTVAYIRSENDESLVYVRMGHGESLQPERLLYDFTNPYEPGGVVRYSAILGEMSDTIPDDYEMEYIDNPFNENDRLPIYNGIIYKLGHIWGPIAKMYYCDDDIIEGPVPKNPKSTNVSHLLFGTKKGYRVKVDRMEKSVRAELADNYSKFAFDIYNKVEAQIPAEDNVVMSPLSVQYALGMLMNGARGNTLDELCKALKMDDYSIEDINYHNLTSRMDLLHYMDCDEDTTVNVGVANGIWSDEGYPFYERFYEVNRENYDSEAKTIELSNQDEIDREIDGWVKDNTNNTIKSVGVKADDYLRMVLVNTLYFKGQWSMPFDEYYTEDKEFHNHNGSTVSVPMMSKTDGMIAFSASRFHGVNLLYGKHFDYSMTLFLPNTDADIPLTLDDWKEGQEELTPKQVSLTMPKFNIDGKMPLEDILKSMGVKDAFDGDKADFSLLSPNQLHVSRVCQYSHIAVDEKGTEASAATEIEMKDTAADPMAETFEVNLNRPFYFTIQDNINHTLMFVGHVKNLGEVATSISDAEAKASAGELYDLQGRRLFHAPEKGIYIMNGRKKY